MNCPDCKSTVVKAIYLGFPMKLCVNEKCNLVYGFWSWILKYHFNGFFMVYEGFYFSALINWLKGDLNE